MINRLDCCQIHAYQCDSQALIFLISKSIEDTKLYQYRNFQPIPFNSANNFSFYEGFCEQHHLVSHRILFEIDFEK